MTSMPDNVWLPWITIFCRNVMSQWLHVKSVLSFRCFNEDSHCIDLYKKVKPVWKVWAHCPHCGEEVFYREPINEGEYLIRGCTACHKLLRIRVQEDKSGNQSAAHNGKREFSPEQIRRLIYEKFLYHFRNKYPAFRNIIKRIIMENAAALYSNDKGNEAISCLMSFLDGMPLDMECESILIDYLVRKNRLREAVNRLKVITEAFPEDEIAKKYLMQVTNAMEVY